MTTTGWDDEFFDDVTNHDFNDMDDFPGFNDMDDPAIGEWEYLPGEVWRETEYLACALIRRDFAALSDFNFPLSDDMLDDIPLDPVVEIPRAPLHPDGWLRCLRCEEWKAPESFGKDSRKRSGRKSWCRVCVRHAERARWQRGKHKRPGLRAEGRGLRKSSDK